MNPELWALFCEANSLNNVALKVIRDYSQQYGGAVITSIFENKRFSLSDIAAIPYEVRYALTWNCACMVRMEEIVAEHNRSILFPHQIAEDGRHLEAHRRNFDLAMRLLNF